MCVCNRKCVRVRQTERMWERKAECLQDKKKEKKRGREGAAVSGIKSRGGRCLFINALWLLKGAFD